MDSGTDAISRHGTWRTYTPADGLAGLRVVHIAEDADGCLWFATTTNGVSRFDGVHFTTFTTRDGLSGDEVTNILAARDGRLWFGCNGGLCWYDAQGFHRLEPEVLGADVSIGHLAEDRDGRIWYSGFSRARGEPNLIGWVDGEELSDLSQAYQRDCGDVTGLCWGIAQDARGDMWFAKDRIVRYDGAHFTSYGTEHGLPAASLNAVATAPDGGPLWVGGSRVLGRFDGRSWEPAAEAITGYVRRIQLDRLGRIWVCDSENGVLCYEGQRVQRLDTEDGLGHPASAVHLDREGHLWFATWGGGVVCYDPQAIHHIGRRQGLPYDTVRSLAADHEGRIWTAFGSVMGPEAVSVARFDGDQLVTVGRAQGLVTIDCMACHSDTRGDLWFGDWLGLIRHDGQSFQRLGPQQGYAGERVYTISEGAEGRLYFGHGDADTMALTTWDGDRFTAMWNQQRLRHHYVSAILERSNGDVWIGIGGLGGQGQREGGGIARIRAAADPAWYGMDEGLPDNRVEDLCEGADGNLWIATVGGLSRFDGSGFETFTTAHGLPSNYVQCLHRDPQGHLWIGSEGGVSRYDGQLFQTIHSEHIGATYRIIQDANGRFWFATQDGLVGYTPSTIPPRVRIEQLVADRVYVEADDIELTASQQATIEYQGQSFRTRPRDMLYISRMHGFEEAWRPATRERSAFYPKLPVGDYRFEVQAIDRDLNVSEPASLGIKVVPDARTEELTAALSGSATADEFVGGSVALRQVQAQLAQVAATDLTVLILGETGTGKGLAARALHQLSPRSKAPFIQVNCGAIAESLVEAELFGHEKGAFTGAVSRRLGRVEVAEGGTLFLDEIGDVPLGTQVKLLQFLQDHTLMRVGGNQELAADVRIVAATNRDLPQMIEEGTFREDLYFRLRIFPVELPPLRQRRDDIPVLAQYFAERFARHLHRPTPSLGPEALEHLQAYHWPGNVRELEHHIQRAVLLSNHDRMGVADVEVGPGPGVASPSPAADPADGAGIPTLEVYRERQAQAERALIERALKATGWTIYGDGGAAQLLDIDPERLRYWMRKHDLRRPV